MIGPRIVVAFLVSVLLGCATATPAQRAYVTGRASKEVIDAAYQPWDAYVRERVRSCVEKLPPAEHTQVEFDMCLGTAIEHERIVVPLLEVYQAAALALYVALTVGRSDQQIIEAQRELARATLELVRKIPGVDDKVRKAKSAIEGI